jgi:thioredoxin 1
MNPDVKEEKIMEYQFNDANFNQEVLHSSQPVLVDFYADWCGPCKMMGPVVKELAEKFDGKIRIGKLNVDENPETAASYGVMSIPSFIFIRNGKVVDRVVGGVPAVVLEEKLSALL